jgi:hypothetical protein
VTSHAPRYWHSRHQHQRVAIGASELSQRTALQRHRPVIFIAQVDAFAALAPAIFPNTAPLVRPLPPG